MSAPAGLAARRAAAQVLAGVLGQRRMLSDMAGGDGPLAPLDPRDRARALALASGVLRHLARLDPVIDVHLDRPPPAAVRNILRIAAFELLVDGVASYAAVDGAVKQVRAGSQARFAGLVNAVGRKLAATGPAALAALPEPRLPGWLEKPVVKAWGEAAAAAVARAHLGTPPVDLTLKDPSRAEEFAEALGAETLPTGSLRLRQAGQISALPGYETGDWWVQDAAAALPVQLLGDVSGLRVADLCAAPGGKTLQLAARGARVTAVDLSEQRLQRLEENLARTGLSARVVASDALRWEPEETPDIVVLDAPCSATGTLRRHPDLPHVRPAPDLSPLLDLQEALIDRALALLAPGGRLLYCTCSLLPREGETQVARARQRHPDLAEGGVRPPGTEDGWWLPTGGLRLRPDYWPDLGGMDGFFATVLTRPA